MSKYNNFDEFMQLSINNAHQELETRYGVSIPKLINSGSNETRTKFADIVKSTAQSFEQRFNQWLQTKQDMKPLISECASSIMLKVVLSNIIL